MFDFLISTAHAQAAGAQGAAGAGPLGGMLPILLVIGVFFVLVIRPQMKQQKELKKMISELKVGDQVIFAGGIHGKIVNIHDDELKVSVALGVDMTIERQAVQNKKQVAAKQLK